MARSIVDNIRYVHHLVEVTLERLGSAASGMRVLDITTTEPVPPPRPGLRSGQHLRVTVGPGPGLRGPDTIGVHFSMTVPLPDATLATVGQVQDQVIEMTCAAVPECPGHPHPLRPALCDGVPSWVCPADPAHHAEPILPTEPDR